MSETAVGRPAPGEARFVDTDDGFTDVLKELVGVSAYGFDTEFHRERTYYAKLALLQLAWPGGLAIVDPLKIEIDRLAEVFAGDGLAVVHACDQDLEILERACGRLPSRIFDTQIAAGFLGMSTPSLGSLVDRLLGLQLEKGDQLTDWTRRPLSEDQRRYAAGDVTHLLELEAELRLRLGEVGRTEWAEGECALLLESARRPSVPEEAWWKLRQSHQLRGAQRGVAQAVAAWRERRAQDLDVPIRTVLSDLALASIAYRPPRSRQDLEGVRGMDRRHLQGDAPASLLAAIEEGRNLPAEAVKLPPVAPETASQRPAIALALAYVQERAHELELDAAILATRADIAAFVKQPPEGRLVDSWRRDLVGEPIRKLVAGEASLAMSAGSLVLEERSGVRLGSTTSESAASPDD
jgi:ribonuclease D